MLYCTHGKSMQSKRGHGRSLKRTRHLTPYPGSTSFQEVRLGSQKDSAFRSLVCCPKFFERVQLAWVVEHVLTGAYSRCMIISYYNII